MNNVTVGKYVPGNSFMHKLNPRVKLAVNIIFIVLVFMSESFIVLGSILSLAILAFMGSGLRKRQLWRLLLPVLFISIFLFAMNAFLLKGGYGKTAEGAIDYSPSAENAIGYFWPAEKTTWWKFTLSDKVVFQTIMILMRIYTMILVTTILTSTTRSMALTRAIEDFLLPLKLFFIPVHVIAMIISIALRFIPTLLEEAQRIMKAQASRGVDFKNGNAKTKAKSTVTLIIPLFVSAFAKAEDLGNAMETRGYDPYEKRTKYRAYPINWEDVLVSTLVTGMIVVIALLENNVFNLPTWWV